MSGTVETASRFFAAHYRAAFKAQAEGRRSFFSQSKWDHARYMVRSYASRMGRAKSARSRAALKGWQTRWRKTAKDAHAEFMRDLDREARTPPEELKRAASPLWMALRSKATTPLDTGFSLVN